MAFVGVIVPFALSSATASLYRLGEDGNPIMEAPVWTGTVEPETLEMDKSFETVKRRPTGVQYETQQVINESHVITIGKLWQTIQDDGHPTSLSDFDMGRNYNYILVLAFRGDGIWLDRWYARIYTGVRAQSFNLVSNEIFDLRDKKVLTAQAMLDQWGTGEFPDVWECS